MLASVSTRVVSWKLAAEMKLSDGRAATLRQHALVLFAEAEAIHLLLEQEVGVADFVDPHPAQHLPHDHLNVLIRDGHALQTVDFLDFIHQISLQFLLTEHSKNVVRIERAVHQRVTGAQAFAFLHVHVGTARHRVLLLVAVVRSYVDLALSL
jgi:hypothetical protein